MRSLIYGVFALGAIYALVLGDLWWRAREAYLQGEKYLRWHGDPEEKKRAIEEEFNRLKADLDRLSAKGRVLDNERRERLELLVVDRDEKLNESAIKYAYIWYQTCAELFSPPESVWVRRARKKMIETKEIWKAELRAKKIPFEEHMLE